MTYLGVEVRCVCRRGGVGGIKERNGYDGGEECRRNKKLLSRETSAA